MYVHSAASAVSIFVNIETVIIDLKAIDLPSYLYFFPKAEAIPNTLVQTCGSSGLAGYLHPNIAFPTQVNDGQLWNPQRLVTT